MLQAKKRIWIEVLLHIAFWIGVFYTLIALTNSHIKIRVNNHGMVMERDENYTLTPYVAITMGFLMLLLYGNIFWLFRKILGYKNVVLRLAIGASWFILIFFVHYIIIGSLLDHKVESPHLETFRIIDPVMNQPPQMPTTDFKVGGWFHMQLIMLLVFLVILGISIAYFFLKEWARSELVQNQLQAQQLNTELKFLKSQINPHFLFNTLNNLFSMAQSKGNDELADGISKLSGMMRYMIYESNEERVPLKKEIEYLQNFIVLNKLRYADTEVKVTFSYPDKSDGICVAPMLFIPFVENAFKHGVSIGQSSVILITISITDNTLSFHCSNPNYHFIKKMEDEKSGIGLDNVKRRLELVYPGKNQLYIDESEGKFSVNLKIDLT